MDVTLVPTQEFNALKQEVKEIKESLNLLLQATGAKSDSFDSKKWLKTSAFMKHFGIKSRKTLESYRAKKLVKAKQRGRTWYYDKESYLPS